jgi:serine phosphatase RsbU (regulator of sigma subunit)
MHILAILDSAITTQKNSRTAELATIYDTQGKEAEIARHQAELSQQRLISTGVALVLLIIFFLTYTLHKRKAAHRLAAAHAQLQVAYDQLETTTKAKERIESELRIARDIQMSMVPNIFPDEKNIDVYAAMTPAKEVGGDLYGYLLLDDEFYFCVGDVSGKGVPASLFMAQATRLFRTFATQHMKPADIATYMNAALTENNEQGMFVTMFIGLINLNSGHMDFCNAGHNPPVWGVPAAYLEMETNAPIGLWPDLDFVGEAMDNIKGCPLLIYTDGLNEAENIQQEQFGDDHLLDILNNNHFTSSRQVIETLVKEVEQHRNGAEPNDDLTIMCLLVKGE